MSRQRNQVLALALCSYLSLEPKSLGDISDSDVKSLYTNCLNLSGKWSAEKENDNAMNWIKFADTFPVDDQASSKELCRFNEDLINKSVLGGSGLMPSEVDIIVFSAIYSTVIGLSHLEKEKLTHVMRWMDYIQNKEDMGKLFDKILLEKPGFEPLLQNSKGVTKIEGETNLKKAAQIARNAENSKADSNIKKIDATEKSSKVKEPAEGKKEQTEGKKKPSEMETGGKEDLSVSLLNIQVGLIRKAWKHPSADSLLVEEIDVGEAKLCQVVSGLAKYFNPDELTNRRVVLITNVKPGKLRDVLSEGLVLCASNHDHTVVEPLLPPEGAKIGEHVSFAGIDGKPEDVLNPKKKQLEKITPNLFTDEKGVATFKGIPFMTSGGPCAASIPKATIK